MVSRVFPERFNESRCAIILELEVDSGRKNSRERTKFCWSGVDEYSRAESIQYVSLQTLRHDLNGLNEAQHLRRRQRLDSDVMACIHL